MIPTMKQEHGKLNDQHIIGISTLRIEMLKEAHMTRARAGIFI